ncbi:hypothetical protein ACRRTK_024529 [Alexandromys fortis]
MKDLYDRALDTHFLIPHWLPQPALFTVEGDNTACKCLKAGIIWRPSWRLVTMATITSAQREVSFLVQFVGFLPFSGHKRLGC